MTLRQRLTAALLAAHFKDRETTVPHYGTGGCFDVVAGVGAGIRIAWWDSTAEERAGLLERVAGELEEAGFLVERRGEVLYVAPQER